MNRTTPEHVVLVDPDDRELGTMEKMEAHEKGLLHRAFSVFVFNDKDELIIHRRALHKYHSAGLWTNTCCSHPRQGESYEEAAHRRLMEEMGFDCPLELAFSFLYKCDFDNGLTEHELDTVLIGQYDGAINANPEEVAEWKAKSMDEIAADITVNPTQYTTWFKIVFDQVQSHLEKS